MVTRTEPLSREVLITARDGHIKGAQRLMDRAKELFAAAERHQKELDDRFYT